MCIVIRDGDLIYRTIEGHVPNPRLSDGQRVSIVGSRSHPADAQLEGIPLHMPAAPNATMNAALAADALRLSPFFDDMHRPPNAVTEQSINTAAFVRRMNTESRRRAHHAQYDRPPDAARMRHEHVQHAAIANARNPRPVDARARQAAQARDLRAVNVAKKAQKQIHGGLKGRIQDAVKDYKNHRRIAKLAKLEGRFSQPLAKRLLSQPLKTSFKRCLRVFRYVAIWKSRMFITNSDFSS